MHIDWSTLALQTVNVLVLIWLLGRFLFRPVRAIIDSRQAAAEQLLTAAAAARAEADAAAAEARTRLLGVGTDGERILTEARAQGESERNRALAETAEAVTHLRDAAKVAIEADRAAMQRVLRKQACDLAVVIAHRLASRLPSGTATASLLEALAAAVAELPEQARQKLASGGPIEIVTAVLLNATQQAECRVLFARLTGAAPELVFRADADLIAGVELHTEGMLIRDSWRADLERIANELNQEEQHEAGSDQLV